MKKYILYVKNNCPFCHRAAELLSEREIDHILISIGTCPDTLFDSLKKAYGQETVPMIFEQVSDTGYNLIGGFTELKEKLEGTAADVG
tara:strand:- start:2420 stop:2683 length:264 start_codon:yes stop_codon:yes gene_type:complete